MADMVTTKYEKLKPHTVLTMEHTVFKAYHIQYDCVRKENYDLKLLDSTWKVRCINNVIHFTLVSVKHSNLCITVFICFESDMSISDRMNLDSSELKKLPLTKRITVSNGIKYVNFEVGIVKDIKKTELSASILNDFQLLLQNEELSDVTILVDKKEFKAHKAILAARSPVFSAMFRHDMTETKENRIEIEEVESEIFQEFLRFIYSGNVSDLEKHTPKLLPIAERYQMDDLKQICEISMVKNINVNNASNAFLLANLYNHEQLKQEAIEFIEMNWKDVVNTTEFENLVKSHPDCGIEIVRINSKS